MAQEPLDRADVVAVLEQVCRKAVPQGVARDAFRQLRASRSEFDRALEAGGVGVMPPDLAPAQIERAIAGWKDELPTELFRRYRPELGCEGVGQRDGPEARGKVGRPPAVAPQVS